MTNKILHLTWGYSMTINNFYKIVRESDKSVWIEQIGNKELNSERAFSGREIPDTTITRGKNIFIARKEKDTDGNMFYKSSLDLSRAHHLDEVTEKNLIDGYYFNHCD